MLTARVRGHVDLQTRHGIIAGMLRRASAAGQDGQTPMTPSRHTSVGGGAAAQVQAQADLRAELEALKVGIA